MASWRFATPEWLVLLLLVPYVLYRYRLVERRGCGSIRYSSLHVFKLTGVRWGARFRHVLIVLRLGALICLVVAMARPQFGREVRHLSAEGVDIVLAVDVSSSMNANDLAGGEKTRLQVAKEVIDHFISGRNGDRIGMVVFAGKSFTHCPLTLDYQALRRTLADVRIADRDWDGTAIGMALINACNRLRDAEGDSRIIILLTDGVNNAGEIEPLTAADVAAAVGIRIYTVGVGSEGTIRQPVQGIFGTRYRTVQVEIDEELLEEVAVRTGGRYFRAVCAKTLEAVYQEIDQLETTEVTSSVHVDYAERFAYLLWPGLFMLVLEMVLANTRFRRIP